MTTMASLKKWLPVRSKSSNKTDGGKVLIIGGGKGLYGAGILSSLAATRCGAGYTHLMTDLSKFPWLKFPDFIVHPLKLSELKNKKEFAVGIGPGLGLTGVKLSLLKFLIKNQFEKVVVDADALTLLAEHNIAPLPASWVMTPHEGELARLLKISSSLVKADREKALKMAFNKFQCTVLLKGSETLIISPLSKKITKLKIFAPSLSKAGTGDVLLGMIVAFRAQGLDPLKASVVGAALHGAVAKEWESAGNDRLSLRPLDLIEKIPMTIKQMRTT